MCNQHPLDQQLTQNWYDQLALCMMNRYQLRRGGILYDFAEIEIYASYPSNTGDPFRHTTPRANAEHLKNSCEEGMSKLFY